MTVIIVGIVLPWLLIVFGGWLFTQFLRQNGRVLLRLEAIEDYLDRMADAQADQHAARNGRRSNSIVRGLKGAI